MRMLLARVDPNDVFFFGGSALLTGGLWWRYGGDVALMVLGAVFLGVALMATMWTPTRKRL